VAYIKQGIRVGRLVPGQRLVERDLIESCAVSRSAIREALRTLAADGTIVIEHRRSAVVRQFSREEVWAQHQIREVLEGLAASLCATRVAQSGLQKELISLEKALADAAKREDRDHYLKLNYQLHSLIAKMSGNPGIQEHLNRAMTTQFRLQAERFWNVEGMRQSHEEHKAIIDSILSGDAERAESAMRRHIRGTRRLLLEMTDSVFPVSHNLLSARLVD
jgi:DNA-binding GntR family transcriptional regulator